MTEEEQIVEDRLNAWTQQCSVALKRLVKSEFADDGGLAGLCRFFDWKRKGAIQTINGAEGIVQDIGMYAHLWLFSGFDEFDPRKVPPSFRGSSGARIISDNAWSMTELKQWVRHHLNIERNVTYERLAELTGEPANSLLPDPVTYEPSLGEVHISTGDAEVESPVGSNSEVISLPAAFEAIMLHGARLIVDELERRQVTALALEGVSSANILTAFEGLLDEFIGADPDEQDRLYAQLIPRLLPIRAKLNAVTGRNREEREERIATLAKSRRLTDESS